MGNLTSVTIYFLCHQHESKKSGKTTLANYSSFLLRIQLESQGPALIRNKIFAINIIPHYKKSKRMNICCHLLWRFLLRPASWVSSGFPLFFLAVLSTSASQEGQLQTRENISYLSSLTCLSMFCTSTQWIQLIQTVCVQWTCRKC